MGYLLKEALKTLCASVNHWSYAVFWKFGCQNLKLLIWEECYNHPESGDLVNKMMLDSHVRILGEGLVGRVAFTGSHQWIVAENCFNETHPPEVVKEVCRQFSAGIQTIAVIPILPLGVVQFGSFSKIAENMGFVYDVVSLILQLGSVSSAFLSNGSVEEEKLTEVEVPMRVGSSISGGMLLDSTAVDTLCSFETPTCVGYSSQTSAVAQTNVAAFHARHPEMLMNQNASLHDSRPVPRLLPSRLSGLNNYQSCFSTGDIYPAPANAITANPGLMNCSKDHFTSCALVESGDDLFDIFGPDYKMNSLVNDELAPVIHNMQPNRSLASSEVDSMTPDYSESGIFSSNGSDNLLEAVVSQVRHSAKASADDSVSCRTTLTNASSSSVPNSSFPYCWSESSAGVKGEFFSVLQYPSKANGFSLEESGVYSQGSSCYVSQINSWMEKDQKGKQTNSVSTAYSKKPHETGKPSRKRLKPGENPRPRPKDRQMIQDRVKELREIVPNGAKCSIDALLERTIKHMLFLQSVMKHTDKLKRTGESKITIEDGGLLPSGSFEGGVTWAYEVGSQSMVCPIRVEDLSQPRQMLIEMICEERGLFLEIADIVRGLGLTILKGIMETQENKIWSRFTVEANRDITRMEIFIALVHLLEQSVKTGTAQPSAINSENQRAPSVPVTL